MVLPYVTPAMFRAHPTFLDLNNLRSGDSVLADQDAELNNVLVMASQWADSKIDQQLGAHVNTDSDELRMDKRGRLRIHASDNPVRALTSIAYGPSINSMTTVTNPTYRIEDEGRLIVVEVIGGQWAWSGPLQFGPVGYGVDLYVDTTYVAGYAHTTAVGASTSGATSITVADATGIYPGDTLRIWEPGAEEAVTVASTYTAGSTTVTLAGATTKNHADGAVVSAIPPDALLAVVNYAVASLMRPDTAAEDAFPDAPPSSTRSADSRKDGSGLVAEAERLLRPYRRVR